LHFTISKGSEIGKDLL